MNRLLVQMIVAKLAFGVAQNRHPFVVTLPQPLVAVNIHQRQLEAQTRLQAPQGLQHDFTQMTPFPVVQGQAYPVTAQSGSGTFIARNMGPPRL